MSTLAVIDYGMGNLHSIAKALQRVSPTVSVWVTSDSSKIRQADRIVFPGVGAIRDCIRAIQQHGLVPVLYEVSKSKPLLGICLGLQALLDRSEECADTECLGVLPGTVVRFPANATDDQGAVFKTPHMGWNKVHQRVRHPLWRNIPQDSRFYFVHSYYADPADKDRVIATTEYSRSFACALGQENICAVQFHPEKSQKVGLQLLENFLAWDGRW